MITAIPEVIAVVVMRVLYTVRLLHALGYFTEGIRGCYRYRTHT